MSAATFRHITDAYSQALPVSWWDANEHCATGKQNAKVQSTTLIYRSNTCHQFKQQLSNLKVEQETECPLEASNFEAAVRVGRCV